MCIEKKKKKKRNIQYGSPGRVQLPPGVAAVAQGLDDLYNCTSGSVAPLNPEAPPTGCPKRHGQIPSPGPETTCKLFGQTPPQITSRG